MNKLGRKINMLDDGLSTLHSKVLELIHSHDYRKKEVKSLKNDIEDLNQKLNLLMDYLDVEIVEGHKQIKKREKK